jgi:uncharacterized protein (TIGR00369 family)
MQRRHHPGCLVCGDRDAGLDLDFSLAEDGAVEATFGCSSALQGYPDRLHGGVISTLIDGAMTNCLFAHGLAGVTAELNVRFRQAAILGKSAKVRAWIYERLAPLFRLSAEVVQETCIVATAEGTFIDMAALDGLPFRTQTT